jgi:AcrR family transcriptional regulator
LTLKERKAQTRAAIVEAARQLFHDQGVDGTSMAQIASLADTGVGTLYGYFPSKDDLLRQVLQSVSDPHVARYVASITDDTSHMQRLKMALEAYSEFLKENRVIMRSAFMAGERHEIASEFGDPMITTFCGFVRDGIAAGEFEPVPVEATVNVLVMSYTMAFLGLMSWWGREDDARAREDLDAIVTSLLTRRSGS